MGIAGEFGRENRGLDPDTTPHAHLLRWKGSIADLRAPWAELAVDAIEPNIFSEAALLEPALHHFCRNDDLRLFLLWGGEPFESDLCGLLPVGPTWQFGRWKVPHVQNWTHANSFLGTPLVREGFEHLFWQHLLGELDGSDWAGFFHINGLPVGGPLDRALREVCALENRAHALVHSEARAFLSGDTGSDGYYAQTVRGKKRKELRRQMKRLSELGEVTVNRHRDDSDLREWAIEFLQLESKGWKGEQGSALDCDRLTRRFFKAALNGVAAQSRLERLDLRLDGKPLAMLANFLCAPGSFSFKTTFDEDYARFSPGVLLQIENLKILDDPDIAWMDSCAAQDHPMIDSLWSGRRTIGRFSVELAGMTRKSIYRGVRLGEHVMARLKGREIVDPVEQCA